MYQMKAKVRLSEADHTKRITFPGIVNYFQDCSTFQSEELGVGFAYLEAHKKAWVLNAWQIVVEEYPAIGEEITVCTWATGFQGLYGTRNFLMQDGRGRTLAAANSVWVFMDLEKGRPAKPAPENIKAYGVEAPLPLKEAKRKIALPKSGEEKEKIPVRRSDIDPNEHVNNSHYIQMALEVLPQDIPFSQVRVEYRKSAVFGDVICPWVAKEEERTVVSLCDTEQNPYAIVELT